MDSRGCSTRPSRGGAEGPQGSLASSANAAEVQDGEDGLYVQSFDDIPCVSEEQGEPGEAMEEDEEGEDGSVSEDSEDVGQDEAEEEEEVQEEEEEDEEDEEEEDEEEDNDEEDYFGRHRSPHSNTAIRQMLERQGCKKLSDIQPEPLEADIAHHIKLHSTFRPVRQAVAEIAETLCEPSAKGPATLLRWRETGAGFSAASRCRLNNFFLPDQPDRCIERQQSRAYIGQFSQDGSHFVGAFQDKRICIYDVEDEFKLRKHVTARNLRWTVTDTCLSPDQRLLVYASITNTVHVVNMGCKADGIYSIANVTDVHEEMHLGGDSYGFGIWSVKWSPDGRELVAGTSELSFVIYDVAADKTICTVRGHTDDVNSVAYLDDSPHLILTGSDDFLCKLWDRRCVSQSRSRPSGVMVGHTEGITHIDSKGDGRHFISNSKDQSIKLWDIRKMLPGTDHWRMGPPRELPRFRWDYRWMDFPGQGYAIKHPGDISLRSFYGHQVLQTLIRSYFSPAQTTGQRYIYTGSSCGAVHIYDILSGEQVLQLPHHKEVVRDCSWHPTLPMLVSVSWDGEIMKWKPRQHNY